MNMIIVQNPKDLILVSKNVIKFLVSYAIIIIFLLKNGVFFLKLVHAVLTNEHPKATFIPKKTGKTVFHILTNGSGCMFEDLVLIFASENPQGPKKNQKNVDNN